MMMLTIDQWGLVYLAIGCALMAVRWYHREDRILEIAQGIPTNNTIKAIAVTIGLVISVLIWPVSVVNLLRRAIKR